MTKNYTNVFRPPMQTPLILLPRWQSVDLSSLRHWTYWFLSITWKWILVRTISPHQNHWNWLKLTGYEQNHKIFKIDKHSSFSFYNNLQHYKRFFSNFENIELNFQTSFCTILEITSILVLKKSLDFLNLNRRVWVIKNTVCEK